MIILLDNLITIVNILKAQGEKIVFTNGCFDILHAGHVRMLREAKRYGDILIVGANSDNSVKRLKGKERPINSFYDRAFLLSELKSVDFVAEFEEDIPFNIISKIIPHVLIKGEDYKNKVVVGRDIVEKNGGKVVLLPLYYNLSTSKIVEKFKK